MRKIWLVFSQAVTITLAVAFVTGTLRPDLLGSLGRASNVVTIREAGQPPAPGGTNASSYRLAAEKASAAVVNVYTTKDIRAPRHPLMKDPFFRRFFGDQPDEEPQRSSSLGSGVIVGASGFILTNHHVIEAADGIEIALSDGRKLAAKVVGTDPETDLAVLKVATSDLPAMTFGQPDAIRVGDVVLAIGNPFGVGQTVTMGIVSGLGRSHVGLSTFENYIQTDAAINPGNSGGALVDTSGNLVGINTAIYSRNGGSMGIGFAIPVSLAKEVMDQIIATGTVTRGWIGVEMQELTPELAESFKLDSTDGTLIAGVIRDSPAEQAGIRPGDILTAVEGKHVTDSSSMLNLIAALQPGKRAVLTVVRNGKSLQISVLVGKRPLQARAQAED
jgi:serine protease DegQ